MSSEKKKKYFISDVHLGLYPEDKSAVRERILVEWLDGIMDETDELFLLGDIFDFWHEYKHVVPRGFVRFLGKLAEMSDKGIQLHFFTGNHDIWTYDYLPQELGLKIYRSPITLAYDKTRFLLAHGDGLGPGDNGYKLMKWGFSNKVLQWFFARIHPNASMAFGKNWSKNSRYAKGLIAEPYKGDTNELQILFAQDTIKTDPIDYFIFGHRHVPFDIKIGPHSRVINLGDWISNFTYAVWDGHELELHSIYPEKESIIYRKDLS